MVETSIKNKVIAIDISLERTTYAVVDVRGNILINDKFCTADYPNVNEFVSALSERVLELVMSQNMYESVRSVGISVKSGNYMTGCIENAVNLPWKGIIPLAAMVRDRMGLAVALASNAHVRGLGEHVFGSAHGMKDFIVVSLGHGLCSCMFSNGHVHLGNDGFAGEFGHTCVKRGGRECGCGRHGCLETYTNERGILRTAQELMAESKEPSMMRDVTQLTPRIIAELCNQGDPLAIEVYRRTGHMLGIGLANYASVLNPEAIIFTGGIPKAGKWLLEPTEESFNQHVYRNMEGKVRFVLSSLDNTERDLLGASVLAWDVKEYSLFK